jgi:general secretion pathway protein K
VCRRRERGVALLAATAALAVLAVLATGLAHTAAVDRHLARHALAALQADALVRSGVAAAAVVLHESRTGGAPDTLSAPWAEDSGRQPLGAGWVAVRVEDEARRLDLGMPALAAALPRLLAVLDLDPALADAIVDWIDPDGAPRPRGAERDWYAARALPCAPRNAPLVAPGELGLVRGVDARVLLKLRPYVTTAGEPAVNPNTASREVLLALLGDAAVVERLLAARARAPIDADALAALLPSQPGARRVLTTQGQHFTVRAVAGVGELSRAAEATVSAPAGADPEVVAWRAVVPEG